ncbi:MAG: CBS domain-containing protein [Actinobacteria bacterium]|uniref:Unannotated protein n=1 Tax=freshwater metagenome TaxID=449393 RepID=A0A6J6NNX2_9ZZZZ|nr:CBS domain-containing protein [Actinomycetota bacterium]
MHPKLIDRTVAETLTVAEVMLPRPKTVATDLTVAQARERFEDQTLRTILFADDAVFRGALDRADLPEAGQDNELAVAFARTDVVTVTPSQAMHDVMAAFEGLNERRIVVLDEDGASLRGLLCLKRDGRAFCAAGPRDPERAASH